MPLKLEQELPAALQALKVIDRLEVGPVRIEPRRMIAPYIVHQGGDTAQFDFTYSYDQNVLDKDDPVMINLACMMAAQPALNYGLFCNQIVFRGPLEPSDRLFLQEMAQNTACEIYVKKFLEPNPFLVGAAAELPTVVAESYLQAELVFDDQDDAVAALQPRAWQTDDALRAAVLSSGGKESLLGYSLLTEIGYECHSIFVNESGRHWFTALNAFRYFSENLPPTARVWTNSDRLFSWMLRRLPFIRPDFADVRADEYPIRLWTVAIFLFGALPLLRKAGVGRLVVGDEYDTTDRRQHNGIVHYNGLFDQSRYFDQYLSDYFRNKGWDVQQFSLLRPLSELLIEKTLVERYPDIQTLQTSCHAAHVDGDRVRPCGKCEKCTRVVGMLTALGVDPCRCGYLPAQVQRCLDKLRRVGAMLEDDALEQLAFLLQQRGVLDQHGVAGRPIHERKHIMQLRFDPERSPREDIPADLRTPLYQLLLQHADGAVRRQDDQWLPFDPIA